MSYSHDKTLKCGCIIGADSYGPTLTKCPLHKSAKNTLAALKQAMYHLTCEQENGPLGWRESQSWREAPYHHLYAAIAEAEGTDPHPEHPE